MRIVGTTESDGEPMDHYGSEGATLTRLAVAFQEAHVNVIHLEAGGHLGRHPATVPQLLLVMQGAGSVAGGDGERTSIDAGQSALWEAGEEHDTRAETAMSLLIVEAAELRVGSQRLRMSDPEVPPNG